MADEIKFWNDCYADGKTGWDRGEVHPALMQFLENGTLTPCSIIVPGCGRGYEVIELARRGFQVTALDIATEPVRQLRRQLEDCDTSSQVLQKSFFDYRPTKPVDWVYEQTCLCAIDPSLRTRYEQTIFDWLKPNGKLALLLVQKSENPFAGPPFHCDLDETKALFPENRWQWSDDKDAVRFEHPSGRMFELAYVLTKLSH